MNIIYVIWAVVNMLLASWLAFMFLINPLLRYVMRRRQQSDDLWSVGFFLPVLCGLAIAHVAPLVVIGYFLSLGLAVIVSAALFLHWALLAYFLTQRFAGTMERTGMVDSMPLLVPACTFLAMVSLAIAFILYSVWYLVPVILLAWFAYGYISTECAIRRYMRKCQCERDHAISVINQNQGRSILSSIAGRRYPFP